MKIKEAPLYIFDMDGTILDSMIEWEHLGRNYLQKKGIVPPDDLEDTIETMTMEESAQYFRNLGISLSCEEIMREMFQCMEDAYRDTIPGKKEVVELIKKLHAAEGNKLCILTTSDKMCAENAMRRLGLLECFSDIYTSEQLGMGKRSGDIYQKVCELYGVQPEKVVVFEDALYAVSSAKEAGCYVYAVSDASNQNQWEQICELADENIKVK